jgi:hypothetical protein
MWVPRNPGDDRDYTECGRGVIVREGGAYTAWVDEMPIQKPRGRAPFKFRRVDDARNAVEEMIEYGEYTDFPNYEVVYKTYDDSNGRGNPDQWRETFSSLTVKNENWHGVLGLEESASWESIKAAYRRLVMEKHPDLGGSEKEFHQIQEAYEALKEHHAR